jgi:hypothetical protein
VTLAENPRPVIRRSEGGLDQALHMETQEHLRSIPLYLFSHHIFGAGKKVLHRVHIAVQNDFWSDNTTGNLRSREEAKRKATSKFLEENVEDVQWRQPAGRFTDQEVEERIGVVQHSIT